MYVFHFYSGSKGGKSLKSMASQRLKFLNPVIFAPSLKNISQGLLYTVYTDVIWQNTVSRVTVFCRRTCFCDLLYPRYLLTKRRFWIVHRCEDLLFSLAKYFVFCCVFHWQKTVTAITVRVKHDIWRQKLYFTVFCQIILPSDVKVTVFCEVLTDKTQYPS